jgi:hypothetical protein
MVDFADFNDYADYAGPARPGRKWERVFFLRLATIVIMISENYGRDAQGPGRR